MAVAEKEIQREEEVVCPTWEKTQEYCDEWTIPPEDALLLDRGWVTEKIVVTYVDGGEYDSRRV